MTRCGACPQFRPKHSLKACLCTSFVLDMGPQIGISNTCNDDELLLTSYHCGQSQARAADAEERSLEARSLQASAERQAERALACLQGLAVSAKEDSSAVDVLQVHVITRC
jgi:hypothetical protein